MFNAPVVAVPLDQITDSISFIARPNAFALKLSWMTGISVAFVRWAVENLRRLRVPVQRAISPPILITGIQIELPQIASYCCPTCRDGIGVFMLIRKKMERDADLPLIADAFRTIGLGFGAGQRWQKERRQDGDDGNHYQEFDESKCDRADIR